MDKLLEKLREPFAREELEFRVGAVNKDKMEGLALAYIQARAIQNRLDELFGIDGWTVSYREVSAGFICYIILAFLGLWYIYRWDDIRVKRKKEQAVVEKDKELHEMEKEFEADKARREKQIVQLEKEKLEYDLQHKSQEMANLMINFVRKNEMLTEIKSEIIKVASSLRGEGAREGKQLLLVINSKIDSNIQSDEVLKRIEDQFDLIHNNFMKRLHVRHPDLSNNERMMCAYLKMNLSTKEIAPLLNISVRGVETIRYRLRKKFGLEREDSLTDYLSNQL